MFAAVVISLLAATAPAIHTSSDLAGRVLFSGLPVPGATVTVAHGDQTLTTVSDDNGVFRFANLDDGAWTIRVEMRGFATASRDVTVPLVGPPLECTLTLLTYAEMSATLASATAAPVSPKPPTASDPSTDAGVLNGSTINGAATVFAQPRAFGNNRPQQRALYTGDLNAVLGNSAWNARPFSFSSSSAPVPSYNDLQLGFTLGGPLNIPGLTKNGPQMVFGLQHRAAHDATTHSAVMPTFAERAGDLSALPVAVRDPLTGLPFDGNIIPPERIVPQASALLGYYPLPNGTTGGANFQSSLVTATRQDGLQLALSKSLSHRTTLTGQFAFQRAATDAVNLFRFADASRSLSINGSLNWTRRLGQRQQLHAKYQFIRLSADVTPFFAGRIDVAGDAGIAGASPDPADWGPPALMFPDIADLTDAEPQHSVTLTHAGGFEALVKRGRHNMTIGADLRWNDVDGSLAANPSGTVTFTGAATGSAFADFLLGIPAASAIAYRADMHLRGATYDAYLNDDFRLGDGLTLTLGIRWEYEAPFVETSGHLVNLDVASGFSAVSPVLASDPTGPLTGTSYPRSLIRPDKLGFEPRLSASWRPVLGSSLVIRGSYALYRNLGVYRPLATLLAQQPPFSTTFSVANSAATPLTLANPFPVVSGTTNTFAVDPDFSPGYVHTWQAQIQRDLPASLTFLAVYDGAKGFDLMQAFLPNTYPPGSDVPSASADSAAARPSGFVYVTSHGTSLRNAMQLTLRRRLHAGLTASVQYTLSKATDNAATFSNTSIAPSALAIAQDWLNLDAERGPSVFDRRHQVAVQFQYTSGVGVAGGTLVDGFWGTLFKDWTIAAQLNVGSGLPLTPVFFATVPGTGVVGVRPALTGVSPAPVTEGTYANAAAFTAPAPGTWGDAGRNSLREPGQFSFDASVSRVFRLKGRMNLEWRLAATNLLNRVTFAAIEGVVGSPQFGFPTLANTMRRLQTTIRFRF